MSASGAAAAELEDEVLSLRRQLAEARARCAQLEEAARGSEASAAPLPNAAEPVSEERHASAAALGTQSLQFQRAAAELFDPHMGVENMGPLLYSLVRFVKPRLVLEVGSGYTSLWILQALAENARELADIRARESASPVPGVPWYVDAAVQDSSIPTLHSVDNMEHAHTTAHKVAECATELGISRHLQIHVADAFDIFDASTAAGQTLASLQWDILWFDGISACSEWPAYFREAWCRLKDRGLALVHSSLTNTTTRSWLSALMEEAAVQGPWVSFEVAPAPGSEVSFGELAARIKESLPAYTWRHKVEAGRLVLQVALAPGCSAFDEGLALADEVAGVDGVGAVTNVLPAKRWLDALHHVGLLEPHKRMQNSVSILQKRAAGHELSEPTFSYLP